LVRPEAGSICWGEVVWFDARGERWVPPEARQLGMVSQDPALWPHLTVVEHLELALRWRAVDRRDRPDRVRELLAMVRLEERAGQRPGGLSGGEAQRLALARSLAGGARLLLLDEPLGQLDAELRPALASEIRRIARAAGTTVLQVTQDPAEAFTYGDRTWVLEQGRMVQWGRPAELTQEPRTRFVAWATGHRNLLAQLGWRALCQGLGLNEREPPFPILEDGAGALTPGMFALAGTAPGLGMPGRVTGARYDGRGWVAVVMVPALGQELEVAVDRAPAVDQPAEVRWRSGMVGAV
jgi:ABC-type Fe3+/spermidine/putrescine transport system ATPase subunit